MTLEPQIASSVEPIVRDTRVKLLAVIVLYRMLPAESPSLGTLLQARDAATESCDTVIFIADNTPGGQDPGHLPDGVFYRAFPDNPGLAKPYNLAICEAERAGCDWILTLDQDTCLPIGFLTSIDRYVHLYGSDDRVAGFVPCIIDNGTTVSPLRFVAGAFPRVIRRGSSGVAKPHTFALNSASFLRISSLKQIGGYDERFPLDNSDTAIFGRLDRASKRIVVAGDVVVQHELAIMQRNARMTPERYRQLLLDERAFWNLYMPLPARIERLIRLVGRLLKGYFTDEDARFQSLTRDEIVRRLSLSWPRSKRTAR